MRLYAFIILMFWSIIGTLAYVGVASAEGLEVDPTQTPTYTLTCIDPIEREDNTPLAVGEIATRNFFVSQDKTDWQPAGSNTSACRQVYDLSQVPDGQYYYTATVIDTDGRESIYSPSIAAVLVKRIQAPRPPTGLSGSAS